MVLLSLLSLGGSPRTRWITTVLPPLVNFMFIRLGPGSGAIIRNSLRRTGCKNGEPLSEALSESARGEAALRPDATWPRATLQNVEDICLLIWSLLTSPGGKNEHILDRSVRPFAIIRKKQWKKSCGQLKH